MTEQNNIESNANLLHRDSVHTSQGDLADMAERGDMNRYSVLTGHVDLVDMADPGDIGSESGLMNRYSVLTSPPDPVDMVERGDIGSDLNLGVRDVISTRQSESPFRDMPERVDVGRNNTNFGTCNVIYRSQGKSPLFRETIPRLSTLANTNTDTTNSLPYTYTFKDSPASADESTSYHETHGFNNLAANADIPTSTLQPRVAALPAGAATLLETPPSLIYSPPHNKRSYARTSDYMSIPTTNVEDTEVPALQAYENTGLIGRQNESGNLNSLGQVSGVYDTIDAMNAINFSEGRLEFSAWANFFSNASWISDV